MASTRELWILLRARDEASRVVSSFSKNIRAAALSTQAAQKSAEAAAIRQEAQLLRSTGATAQQIRAINDNVIALEKEARAQTMAATTARSRRAEMMATIGPQVKQNNLHAAGLERQARALTLAAAMGDEHRTSLIRITGATNENTAAIDGQISTLRKRAATLNAEAAVSRAASNSMIAQISRESVGLEDSIRTYERRAAAIRAQAAILRNAAQEQGADLNNQVRALTDEASALDRQANALRQSANAAREHDNKIKALTQSLGKVSEASTVVAFSLAAIGAGGLIGIKLAIDDAVKYERQVRSTSTQVGAFGASLKELGDIGKRIAGEIGVAFEQIQPALFDIFSSMDVNVKDSEKLLRSFSKAAVAGQVEITAVSRATIGMLNAFHRPASDVNHILDLQFQLVKLGVGTYEEWNQRIGLVTPSAVRAGQSIEMMTAALATSTRMGISAARSGTSVARAMDAMSHPAAVKNMEQLGIKVRDASGKLRPMNEILRQFRDVLMKMPEKDRVAAILDVFKGAGGTIEARRFLQNLLLGKGNLELFDSVLQRTKNSAGSMEAAYKTMADSTATKTQLLSNKWQLLKVTLGEALLPQFNKLLDIISQAMDWFDKLPNSTKGSIAQFILWGSIIAIVLAGMFAFIGVGAMFIAAIASIGAVAAVTLGVLAIIPLAIVALGAAFYVAYQKSVAFRDVINEIAGVFGQVAGSFIKTGKSIRDSFEKHILPPLSRLTNAIQNVVIPMVQKFADMFKNDVAPKIEEAQRIIRDLADGALKRIGDVIDTVVIPAVDKMAQWWKENQSTLEPLIKTFGQLVKWVMIVGAVITGILIAIFVGPLIGAIIAVVAIWQGFVMAIVAVINWVKNLWASIQELWGTLQQFGSTIGQMFQDVWNSILEFFQGLFNWFQQLPGQILGFIQGIPGMLGDLFTRALNAAAYAVGYGLGLIYVFFTELVPKAIGFITSLPARLAAIFTLAWNAAVQIVSQMVSGIVDWFYKLPSRSASAISSLWGSIRGHFNSARDGAISSGKSLVDGVIKFFTGLPGRAATALGRVRDSVVGAFKGAAGWLIGAGEDIIRGVINGIGNMIGGAVDAARNAAHRMVKGFRDAISSKSPSKVFADIGKDMILGLNMGLVDNTQRAVKEMKNLASVITDQASSGLAFAGSGVGVGVGAGVRLPAISQNNGAGTTVINQTINVQTNEIDPRRHAQSLGWELQGRLK